MVVVSYTISNSLLVLQDISFVFLLILCLDESDNRLKTFLVHTILHVGVSFVTLPELAPSLLEGLNPV